MLWCKRGEAIEKRRGGGGCCLRADHGMGSGCVGRVLSIQEDLQITSRDRLVVLYCINYATGADLTISVKLWQIHVFQRQQSSTL